MSSDPLQPVATPIDLLAGLDQLRAAWARTKAGQGGIAALAGFEFQITQVLLEVIRSEGSGGGLVLMEVLSDSLREDGGLVVSQLKRTLSSGALHKALEELWQIEQLARTATPGLRPLLRYQVQAIRRDLQDVCSSLERWTPGGVDAGSPELAEFKARVQADVVCDPRLEAARLLVEKFVDPTPFQTVDRFAGMLLRAGDEKGLERASEEIRTHLGALRASASDRTIDFRIWGETDRSPSTTVLEPDPRRAVRVGQRLSIADLISGRLADRSVYSGLHADAEDWLSAHAEGTDKVPTFWIEGRSGAGKSAALLHLLAKLHEEDRQRLIVWLGPRSDRLGEVLRRFRDAVEDGRRLIIAIDDPLAPDQQQAFIAAAQSASDEWTRLNGALDSSSAPLPPCIICCGPTEQREFGEDNCYAELDISPWALASETPEDIDELARWYNDRTGKRPPQLEGDVLLVQRFFEWDQGSIRDFALRFKSRLEGFGRAGNAVFDLVARILAFGRLYADYPASSLQAAINQNPDIGRAFDRLAEEEAHLTFQPDGDGVRMTHPHLADAIYREWFGRSGDSHARKQHLQDGIRDALSQTSQEPAVRLAPLWAIARLARGPESGRPAPPELQERLTLIESEVRQLLPVVYAGLNPAQAGPADLPVWLVLDQALGLSLAPAPMQLLRSVIDAAEQPRQGLRLSCHVLLASVRRGDADDPHARVAELLHRLVDWRDEEGLPWRDWAYVAADLIAKGGASLIVDDVLRLIDRAPKWSSLRVPVTAIARRGAVAEAVAVESAWLAATQNSPHVWDEALQAAHERRLPIKDLGDLSARFLLASPHHRAWPTIWRATLESGLIEEQAMVSLGLAWLGIKPEAGIPIAGFDAENYHKVFTGVLAHIGGEAAAELVELGLAWLAQSSLSTNGWSAIWSAVWSDCRLLDPDIETVRQAGMNALRTLPNHREWSFIWHGFVRTPRAGSTDDLIDLALVWLSRVSARHAGWVYVLETLYDQLGDTDPRREKLRALGRDWLLKVGQHRGWAAVWENLRRDRLEDQAICLQIGQEWLARTPTHHPGWPGVAHQVLRATPRSHPFAERFGEAGCVWLRHYPNDRHWVQMFRDLAPFLSPAELEGFAAEALERARQNGGPAPRLVRAILLRETRPDRRLVLLTGLVEWLRTNFDDDEWAIAWTILATSEDRPVTAEELLDIASEWSKGHGPTSREWPHLWPSWHFLLRKVRPEELVLRAPDALACLLSLPLHHGRWSQIWLSIRHDAPDLLRTREVLDCQRNWLIQPIRDTDKWSRVFKEYRRNRPDWSSDSSLVAQLDPWLAAAEGSEMFWSVVWSAARSRAPLDPGFHARSASWLKARSVQSSGWSQLWRHVIQGAEADAVPELIDIGKVWLEGQPNRDGEWRSVARIVERLSSKARRESGGAGERPEIPQLAYDAAAPNQKSSEERVGATRRGRTRSLLATISDPAASDYEWVRAWSSFVKVMTIDDAAPEVGAWGLAWLSGPSTEEMSWPWIWKDLWTNWPDLHPELRQLGRNWLRGRNPATPGRYHVQKTLFGFQARRQNKTPEV